MVEKKTAKEASVAEPMNTRWWESYLVRYFVGFIVGIACVSLITHELCIAADAATFFRTNGVNKPDWSAIVFLVALAGLGYCYIASTPITVLHAGRYGRGPIDGQSRYFWISWVVLLLFVNLWDLTRTNLDDSLAWVGLIYSVVGLIGLGREAPSDGIADDAGIVVMKTLAWSILLISTACIFQNSTKIDTTSLRLMAFALPVFWIGLVQYAVLWRILFQQEKLESFYIRLFNARRLSNSRDVRDTYTHLREHSNSVFIVLVELCLLSLFLAGIRMVKKDGCNAVDWSDYSPYILSAIGIWMVPTVFMWSRANHMEARFSQNPDSFLDSSKAIIFLGDQK